MRSPLFLILAAPLTACATMSATATAGPVAVEQTQRVGALRVTPIELKEDSRCPMNARCIWAGRVVVRAAIDDGNSRLERNLTLGAPVDIGGSRLVLDGVTPERNAGTEVSVAAYRFHVALVAR